MLLSLRKDTTRTVSADDIAAWAMGAISGRVDTCPMDARLISLAETELLHDLKAFCARENRTTLATWSLVREHFLYMWRNMLPLLQKRAKAAVMIAGGDPVLVQEWVRTSWMSE
jgi:hypothetical protein